MVGLLVVLGQQREFLVLPPAFAVQQGFSKAQRLLAQHLVGCAGGCVKRCAQAGDGHPVGGEVAPEHYQRVVFVV